MSEKEASIWLTLIVILVVTGIYWLHLQDGDMVKRCQVFYGSESYITRVGQYAYQCALPNGETRVIPTGPMPIEPMK